jgi:condensin complex subunit 2
MHRSKSTHRVGVPHRTLTSDSLNDDSAEKRARREERVANKHLERQKVVAAAATHASPIRNAQHAAPTSPPRTPNGTVLKAVDGASATPVKKVPILANFEEWMKMATDNVLAVLYGVDDRKSMQRIVGISR